MFKLLRFGIKAGIATSAVYLTIDNGVWKDSETTTTLYTKLTNDISTQLSPYIQQIPIAFPELPKSDSTVSNLQVVWNNSVLATFRFIVASPYCAVGYAKKGYVYVVDKINEASENNKE